MNIVTLAGSLEEYSGMRSTLMCCVCSSFPFSHSITQMTGVAGGPLSAYTNFFLLFLPLDMFVLLAWVLPFKAPSWESRQMG